MGLAQLLDEGRDVEALDVLEREPAGLGPVEEPPGVPVVGRPRVLVPDGVGEEGEEPLGRLGAPSAMTAGMATAEDRSIVAGVSETSAAASWFLTISMLSSGPLPWSPFARIKGVMRVKMYHTGEGGQEHSTCRRGGPRTNDPSSRCRREARFPRAWGCQRAGAECR